MEALLGNRLSKMKKILDLNWNGTELEFTGNSPNGVRLAIDGNGVAGTSPMVLLLHSLAGCAAIDIVVILNRMRVKIDSLRVELEAEREEGEAARKWTRVHLRFFLTGDIPEKKAKRSVDLSVKKYCSVYRQLDCSAEITTELVLS